MEGEAGEGEGDEEQVARAWNQSALGWKNQSALGWKQTQGKQTALHLTDLEKNIRKARIREGEEEKFACLTWAKAKPGDATGTTGKETQTGKQELSSENPDRRKPNRGLQL